MHCEGGESTRCGSWAWPLHCICPEMELPAACPLFSQALSSTPGSPCLTLQPGFPWPAGIELVRSPGAPPWPGTALELPRALLPSFWGLICPAAPGVHFRVPEVLPLGLVSLDLQDNLGLFGLSVPRFAGECQACGSSCRWASGLLPGGHHGAAFQQEQQPPSNPCVSVFSPPLTLSLCCLPRRPQGYHHYYRRPSGRFGSRCPPPHVSPHYIAFRTSINALMSIPASPFPSP